MPELRKDGVLNKGEKLHGMRGVFKIVKVLGKGRSGVTYKAQVVSVNTYRHSKSVPPPGSFVVIKTPLVEPQTIRRLTDRLGTLYTKSQIEVVAGSRLRGFGGAAQVVDVGLHLLSVGTVETEIFFLVQQFIEGVLLTEYLAVQFATGNENFNGIPDGARFLRLAAKITSTLGIIHQRGVVHGDIHEENIMVTNSGQIVFIDFGEALLRDLCAPGPFGALNSGMRCVPPEGSGTVGADVYSLGGLFYYLATGRSTTSTELLKDLDDHRQKIAAEVERKNTGLYRSNRGIVDIIARCLRHYQADRPPNTDAVRRDLETFGEHGAMETPEELVEALGALDKQGNDLYSWMAHLQIRSLRGTIEDMTKGFYDLVGSHEDIVSGMTEYLSVLKKDDQYLTVSLPSFWSRRNLGTNGRFLSMNILAAQRGAEIRRVFLIAPEESEKAEVKEVILAHTQLERDLVDSDTTGSTGTHHARLETRVEMVASGKLESLALEGKHNSLLSRTSSFSQFSTV